MNGAVVDARIDDALVARRDPSPIETAEVIMMVDKQTPAQMILLQVIQQLHEGNYQVALDYGFTWDDVRVMESLSFQDFHWLKTQSAQFIEFEVNSCRYSRSLPLTF